MKRLVWLCVLLAGCGGGAPTQDSNPAIKNSLNLILNAIEFAKRNAAQYGYIHFVYIDQKSVRVFRDNDNNGKIEIDKGDVRVILYHLYANEQDVYIVAPEWYACDPSGTPVWSSNDVRPPDIIIRDVTTGERVELKMDPNKFKPAKMTIYGPGGKRE